jgi:hypothetical protein
MLYWYNLFSGGDFYIKICEKKNEGFGGVYFFKIISQILKNPFLEEVSIDLQYRRMLIF